MMKIAIVGAYGAGKTTLIERAGRLLGIPAVHGTPMRDPRGSAPTSLEQATEAELIQLVVRRYTERLLSETARPGGFLSDGSLLHEWTYATIRLALGPHPAADAALDLSSLTPYQEVLDRLGPEIAHQAAAAYDEIVHLPVEFPLADETPPISERFRELSDQLLLDTFRSAGRTVHAIKGPIDDRVSSLVAFAA
jgi:hypothetical protein